MTKLLLWACLVALLGVGAVGEWARPSIPWGCRMAGASLLTPGALLLTLPFHAAAHDFDTETFSVWEIDPFLEDVVLGKCHPPRAYSAEGFNSGTAASIFVIHDTQPEIGPRLTPDRLPCSQPTLRGAA